MNYLRVTLHRLKFWTYQVQLNLIVPLLRHTSKKIIKQSCTKEKGELNNFGTESFRSHIDYDNFLTNTFILYNEVSISNYRTDNLFAVSKEPYTSSNRSPGDTYGFRFVRPSGPHDTLDSYVSTGRYMNPKCRSFMHKSHC